MSVLADDLREVPPADAAEPVAAEPRLRRMGGPLVTIGLVGITAFTFWPPHASVEVWALTAAVASLVVGALALAGSRGPVTHLRVLMVAGTIAVVVAQSVASPTFYGIHVFVVTVVASLVLAAVAVTRHAVHRRWAVFLVIAAVVLVAAASGSLLGDPPPDIDVVGLHGQAVDALLAGENPYTTGNVSVLETKPLGDNELIQEYTYPPINLVWYAVGDAVSGDVRTGGAIALVLAVALFALVAIERSSAGPGKVATCALAALAFVISNQAMYFMVVNGWTEVTVLPFLLVAVLWWRKRPVASAIALGLGLASKQYFLLVAPVLFLLPGPWRSRRGAIATASATATLLPFLIWDARGLIDGIVIHHLTREARLDSATWASLGIEIPSAIAVILAVAIGVWLARRATSAGAVMTAFAAVLAVFTLLAIRGFVNSWWLVFWMAVVGLVTLEPTGHTRRPLNPSFSDRELVGQR